jgi:hypothetical protein
MTTDAAPSMQGHHDIRLDERAPESAEDIRISLGDPRQIEQWATKLGISQEHLRELVAQAGPRLCDVRQRLDRPAAED